MKIPKVLFVFVIIIFLFILATFFPFGESKDYTSIVLTISTFLFGIFMAFSINDRKDRVDRIRQYDSEERAALESIFILSIVYGKEIRNKIADSIDNYLVALFDYTIWDYRNTEKEFNQLAEMVISLDSEEKKTSILDNMLDELTKLRQARAHTITLISDRLSFFEWAVVSLLSIIIIIACLVVNIGTFFSIIVTTSLNLLIILLITFLHELDSLGWKEEVRIFEPYQRTFDAIGKLRYYPEDLVQQKRVKIPKGITYRFAIYSASSNLSDKKIEILKN
jgi:hypothetical protein